MKRFSKLLLHSVLCICILGTAALNFSCKRSSDGKDFLGEKVVPARDGFYVLMDQFTASPASVNFATTSVDLIAVFSDEVTWTLTLRGVQSGAIKKITKTSALLDEEWDGGSSNVFFFRTGEKAIAELSFMGTDLVLKDTVTIGTPKIYDGKTFNGIKMTVIDDFDAVNRVAMTQVEKDLNDAQVVMSTDTTVKVQELNGYLMSGIDVSKNGWCGGISHSNMMAIKLKNKCPLVTDPEQLYVNLYIYGTGHPNSAVRVRLYEVDEEVNFNNASYVYQRGSNDAWEVTINVNWIGWKCISKKYGTFTVSKEPTAGGSGNKVKQPHRITGADIALLSLPDAGASPSVYMDYLVFSEGGVFIP